MERADELKERIRQQPLNDRLEESRRRIGDMCSKGRCPKMTIPVQHDDDDFYINTTLADAQATIAALQARVEALEGWQDGVVTAFREAPLEWSPDLGQGNIPSALPQIFKNMHDYATKLTQRTAEFQRHDGELQQICGQALGYPWFKDDQKNFPGATEKGGVCVGEHVGITIAQELANAYRKRTAELEAIEKILDIDSGKTTVEKVRDLHHSFKQVWESYQDASNEMFKAQAALERVRGELAETSLYLQQERANRDSLAACVDRDVKTIKELRTLILTLPKVEGDDEAAALVYGSWFRKGRNEQQFDAALAALLKHRQGMEG